MLAAAVLYCPSSHARTRAGLVFGNIEEARIVNRDDNEHPAPSGSWIAADFRHGSGLKHRL